MTFYKINILFSSILFLLLIILEFHARFTREDDFVFSQQNRSNKIKLTNKIQRVKSFMDPTIYQKWTIKR